MTNPNFAPQFSTNDIWRDLDSERCLTDDLDAIEANVASLGTNITNLGNTYAPINHTHSGYATSSDISTLQSAISNKADVNHTHTGYALSSHNHNDIYYTETEVDSLLSNKAASSALTSHTGNSTVHITSSERTAWNAAKTHADSAHAPSNAEANQNAFSNVKIGNFTIAADSKTDTLTLVAGSNITITPDTSGDSITISSSGTSYTHPTSAGNKHIPAGGADGQILRWSSDGTATWGADYGDKIVTTGGSGAAYTATVDGITALTAGASFIMVPHVASTVTNPTLNVNGLGAKNLRRRISNSTYSTVAGSIANWLGAGKPIRVTFDGNFWIVDFTRPNANDIYGAVAIENGGTGGNTAEKARTNLDVYSKAEVQALIAEAIANL